MISRFFSRNDSPSAPIGSALSHPVVVHSAFPKSGSQSIREMIRQTLGERTHLVIPKSHSGFGHNVISPHRLPHMRRFFRPCLLYGHIPPTGYNIARLGRISSLPWFVSIRGLKDVAVSYKDHVDRSGMGPLDYRLPGLSEGLEDWSGMEDDGKLRFIIRFIMPWYVRFVAGWQHVGKSRPVIFVRYEDVVERPRATREMLAGALGTALCAKSAEKPMPRVNFNVGEKHRGVREISPELELELEKLLEFYPALHDTETGVYLMQRT